MQSKFDFIIAGQGIAGTLLTHSLLRNNKSVLVIDDANPNTASKVAAGIIHPITGRRLVKNWLYDEAYPVAIETYAQLEKQFGQTFFHQKKILDIITSIKNYNDWQSKTTEQGFENLIGDFKFFENHKELNAPFGAVEINGGGQLLIADLVNCYSWFLKEKELLLSEKFEYENLNVEPNKVRYKEFEAGAIIFCEGWKATKNSFFFDLPFQPAKGEVLIIECPDLSAEYILNKGCYILPIGNNLFKIGATFDWQNLNSEPTEEARKFLSEEFSSIVKSDFKIVDQYAAVRPTVKDRRPLLQQHSEHKNLFLFNGLGTKGVLLAPYLAQKMTELIEGKKLELE